ncbi:hypothetical protein [Flavobacterium sp.]|uniref:hypothetical protein n=1 Tax=Flavobacterium sp. TaxID=239 RepID=UPI0040332E7D
MPPIAEIINYLVSAGGAYAWFAAGRLRKAGIRKAEVDADNAWRQFYKDLVSDMKTEIGQLKHEVFMLRATVEKYRQTCDNCPTRNGS